MTTMPDMSALDSILAQGIEVELDSGDVTPVAKPHSTGWRILPGLMLSQIQRGRDRMCLDGGVVHPVPTGALMVLPAGRRHCIDLQTPHGRARWVHLSYRVLGGLDLFSLVEIDPVLPPAIGTPFGDIIEDWVDRRGAQQSPLLRAAARRALGFRLLEILAPICRERPETNRRMEALHHIRPVIDHLQRNFARSTDRDQLALMAGMPTASFHRAFRACTGTTPIDYLRRLRFRRAQHLLIAGDLSVAEIAHRCGYDDPFIFSRAFRCTCGVSPQLYRQVTHDLSPGRASTPSGPADVL